MTVKSDEYRRVLGRFASGVTVLSAWREPGLADGVTVSAFSALSLHPPLVLACVGDDSDCHELLAGCERFAVNVLAADQRELALAFAALGRDKAAALARHAPWTEGAAGAPLLHRCLAQLSCRRRATHRGGDHSILIGEVESLRVVDPAAAPLVYYASAFHGLS